MAASALVDAGFLVALLSRRDDSRRWAAEQTSRFPLPWMTCEAVLSETFHRGRGMGSIAFLLRRGILISGYRFADDPEDAVLKLLEKYSQRVRHQLYQRPTRAMFARRGVSTL